MTKSNPFVLVVKDPKIERIASKNLRVRIRKRVEELGVELDNIQSENTEDDVRVC